MIREADLKEQIAYMKSILNERQYRCYLGTTAISLGRGGQALELIPKLDLMNRKELAPNDDGTSKMNESKIVVSLLFIAHEKFSKTVHVRMKQLDDPSARLKVWVLFLLFFLFPSRNNVGLIMTIGDGFLLSCIASIKAKILGMFFCYFWASNHYIIERVFQ